MRSEVYARAGAQIFDADRRLVATVARDVHVGEVLMPDHFTFHGREPPLVDEAVPRAILEFSHGWRPAVRPEELVPE